MAGVGMGLWNAQRKSLPQQGLVPVDVAAAWQDVQLRNPAGEPASLPVGESRFLLNFWATWCPPCLHEMPLLEQAYQLSLPVHGLAVDEIGAVNKFLAANPVSYPIVVAGLNGGLSVAERLGNDLQAMPYSVVVERSGQLGQGKVGVFSGVDEIMTFFSKK